MSNVVAFRPNTSRKAIVRKLNDTGRILFFTGVRYVRDDDVEAAPNIASCATPAVPLATERLQA